VMGNRVLVADLAWGSRRHDRPVPGMWLDYGASMDHAGLVVERVNGRKLPNRLQLK
jgi:hypothetical protein